MRKINISHGLTFSSYLSYLGFILMILGGVGLALHISLILSILSLIIGVFLFISIRGIIINEEALRIKPYLNILFFKIGKWYDVNDYDVITLRYLKEAQTMNMQSITRTYSVQTYDINLESKKRKKIFINDFSKRSEAELFLAEYAKILHKPMVSYLNKNIPRKRSKRR